MSIGNIPTFQHAELKATDGALHNSYVPAVGVGSVVPTDIGILVVDSANPNQLYRTTGTATVDDYLLVGGLSGSSTWGSITGNIADQTDLTLAALGGQPADAELDKIAAFGVESGYLFRNGSQAYEFISFNNLQSSILEDALVPADVGVTVQGFDSTLQALSGLNPVPGNAIGWDETNNIVNIDLANFGAGDMLKTVYDTDDDGTVDSADIATIASAVAWSGVTSKPSAINELSGLVPNNGFVLGWENGVLANVSVGNGDMLRSIYDTNLSGIVDQAENVDWAGVTNKPTVFNPAAHTHLLAQVTDSGVLATLDEINDAQVAAAAAIAWSKISKTGALPGEVGAQAASTRLDDLVSLTAVEGEVIGWANGQLTNLPNSGVSSSGSVTRTIEASENLTAGDWVNIHDSSGLKVRQADASSNIPVDGFVLANVASGQNATVYLEGDNDQITLTEGDIYYLGETGQETNVEPLTSGTLYQVLGKYLDGKIRFKKTEPIYIL